MTASNGYVLAVCRLHVLVGFHRSTGKLDQEVKGEAQKVS